LSFSAAPDFETQPTYAVTVQAQVRVGTPTASMASLDVTVEVENVEEAGSIGLPSTPPKVGTAVVAELTDPDGSITGACWIWQRAPDATSTTWEDRTACPDGVAASVRAESAEPYPELSSYTPEKDDIGYLLRATVCGCDRPQERDQ
ncbi:MAG: hypothetical protein J4F35_20220, partial [Candidatus Latescibacteria bacterium]|nr:hypothetical protein [Candidatus Latescibacterota bacterium]